MSNTFKKTADLPANAKAIAAAVLRRGVKPLVVAKVGSKWTLSFCNTELGHAKSKKEAVSIAGTLGMHLLDLGQFTYSYTKGV